MSRAEYQLYLMSPWWLKRRKSILQRAREHCEWCGTFAGKAKHDPDVWCRSTSCKWCNTYFDEFGSRNDMERQTLEVHHRTYVRRGKELDDDLVALCHTCHDTITGRQKSLEHIVGRSPWLPKTAEKFFGNYPKSVAYHREHREAQALWRENEDHS